MEVKSKLKVFAGKWLVTRYFADKDGALLAVGKGTVTFNPINENELSWKESLNINWKDGGAKKAYASYTLKYDNDSISKYTKSGKLMYQLLYSMDDKEAHGIHECGKDSYASFFKFISEKSFIQKYDVVGPMKNFTIESEYIKDLAGKVFDDFDLNSDEVLQ